jgi:hypothetical protein
VPEDDEQHRDRSEPLDVVSVRRARLRTEGTARPLAIPEQEVRDLGRVVTTGAEPTIQAVLRLATATGIAVALVAGAAQARTGSVLTRVVLRPAQVGPGYRLQQRPDGHGVRGLVTLDLCGFTFPSERLRTARLQVNYVRSGSAVQLSNEVVTYRRGGAQQALREVAYAARHCPRHAVGSTVAGVPKLTYRIGWVHDRRLLPGAVALRVRASGMENGKRVEVTTLGVYQVRRNVLSGVYTYGRSFRAELPVGLHAAAESALNLKRL